MTTWVLTNQKAKQDGRRYLIFDEKSLADKEEGELYSLHEYLQKQSLLQRLTTKVRNNYQSFIAQNFANCTAQSLTPLRLSQVTKEQEQYVLCFYSEGKLNEHRIYLDKNKNVHHVCHFHHHQLMHELYYDKQLRPYLAIQYYATGSVRRVALFRNFSGRKQAIKVYCSKQAVLRKLVQHIKKEGDYVIEN